MKVTIPIEAHVRAPRITRKLAHEDDKTVSLKHWPPLLEGYIPRANFS
jgi:hypothetical protein